MLARGEEQRALGDSVARTLADAAPLGRVRELYGDARPADQAAWKSLVDLGVPGALVPEEFGGLGLLLADVAGVLEASGRAVFGGPLIAALSATAALHDPELLAAIADGSVTAVLVDGSGPVLDGTYADVFLLPADDGLLAVDAAQAEVVHVPTLDGSRSFAEVRLDPDAGRPVRGDAAAGRAVTTVAMCADGFGAAAAAFELAVAHAMTREQFGVPIGSFQAVQHLLVDAYTALRLGGLAVRAALDAPGPREVATAQAACADAFAEVAATAIQVLGGLGYTWESDAHLYYKRLLTLQTSYGGRDQALDVLAALTIDSSA